MDMAASSDPGDANGGSSTQNIIENDNDGVSDVRSGLSSFPAEESKDTKLSISSPEKNLSRLRPVLKASKKSFGNLDKITPTIVPAQSSPTSEALKESGDNKSSGALEEEEEEENITALSGINLNEMVISELDERWGHVMGFNKVREECHVSFDNGTRKRFMDPDLLRKVHCSICWRNVSFDEHDVLPCGHHFHQQCLEDVIGDSCPDCRAPRSPFNTSEHDDEDESEEDESEDDESEEEDDEKEGVENGLSHEEPSTELFSSDIHEEETTEEEEEEEEDPIVLPVKPQPDEEQLAQKEKIKISQQEQTKEPPSLPVLLEQSDEDSPKKLNMNRYAVGINDEKKKDKKINKFEILRSMNKQVQVEKLKSDEQMANMTDEATTAVDLSQLEVVDVEDATLAINNNVKAAEIPSNGFETNNVRAKLEMFNKKSLDNKTAAASPSWKSVSNQKRKVETISLPPPSSTSTQPSSIDPSNISEISTPIITKEEVEEKSSNTKVISKPGKINNVFTENDKKTKLSKANSIKGGEVKDTEDNTKPTVTASTPTSEKINSEAGSSENPKAGKINNVFTENDKKTKLSKANSMKGGEAKDTEDNTKPTVTASTPTSEKINSEAGSSENPKAGKINNVFTENDKKTKLSKANSMKGGEAKDTEDNTKPTVTASTPTSEKINSEAGSSEKPKAGKINNVFTENDKKTKLSKANSMIGGEDNLNSTSIPTDNHDNVAATSASKLKPPYFPARPTQVMDENKGTTSSYSKLATSTPITIVSSTNAKSHTPTAPPPPKSDTLNNNDASSFSDVRSRFLRSQSPSPKAVLRPNRKKLAVEDIENDDDVIEITNVTEEELGLYPDSSLPQKKRPVSKYKKDNLSGYQADDGDDERDAVVNLRRKRSNGKPRNGHVITALKKSDKIDEASETASASASQPLNSSTSSSQPFSTTEPSTSLLLQSEINVSKPMTSSENVTKSRIVLWETGGWNELALMSPNKALKLRMQNVKQQAVQQAHERVMGRMLKAASANGGVHQVPPFARHASAQALSLLTSNAQDKMKRHRAIERGGGGVDMSYSNHRGEVTQAGSNHQKPSNVFKNQNQKKSNGGGGFLGSMSGNKFNHLFGNSTGSSRSSGSSWKKNKSSGNRVLRSIVYTGNNEDNSFTQKKSVFSKQQPSDLSSSSSYSAHDAIYIGNNNSLYDDDKNNEDKLTRKLEILEVQKKEFVKKEDYDNAAIVKRQIDDLILMIEDASNSNLLFNSSLPSSSSSSSSSSSLMIRAALSRLKILEQGKKVAVETEDYLKASLIKKQIQELKLFIASKEKPLSNGKKKTTTMTMNKMNSEYENTSSSSSSLLNSQNNVFTGNRNVLLKQPSKKNTGAHSNSSSTSTGWNTFLNQSKKKAQKLSSPKQNRNQPCTPSTGPYIVELTDEEDEMIMKRQESDNGLRHNELFSKSSPEIVKKKVNSNMKKKNFSNTKQQIQDNVNENIKHGNELVNDDDDVLDGTRLLLLKKSPHNNDEEDEDLAQRNQSNDKDSSITWESPSKRPLKDNYLSQQTLNNKNKAHQSWLEIRDSVLVAKTNRKQTEKEMMELNQTGVGPLIKNFDTNKTVSSSTLSGNKFSLRSASESRVEEQKIKQEKDGQPFWLKQLKKNKQQTKMTQDDSASTSSTRPRLSISHKWSSCSDVKPITEQDDVRGMSLNRGLDNLAVVSKQQKNITSSRSVFSTSPPKLRSTGFFDRKESTNNNQQFNNGNTDDDDVSDTSSDNGSIVWDATSKRTILLRSPSPAPTSSSSITDNKLFMNQKNNQLIQQKPGSIHGVKLKPASVRSLTKSSKTNMVSNVKPIDSSSCLSSTTALTERSSEEIQTDKQLQLSDSEVAGALTASLVLSPNTKLKMVEHESDFRKGSIAVHSIQHEEENKDALVDPSMSLMSSTSSNVSTANRLAQTKKTSEQSLLNKKQNSIGDDDVEDAVIENKN